MTLERQKYLEPFIIAQNQGKSIQIRTTEQTEWLDLLVSVVERDDQCYEYRIKPEPREWYKILNNDNGRMTKTNFNTYKEAKESLEMITSPLRKDYAKNFEVIKVREVIE